MNVKVNRVFVWDNIEIRSELPRTLQLVYDVNIMNFNNLSKLYTLK